MKHILTILMLTISLSAFAQDRCKGAKKDGTACKITKVDKDSYCRFHSPNTVKCAGTKKDGSKCKLLPGKGSKFCHLHNPKP